MRRRCQSIAFFYASCAVAIASLTGAAGCRWSGSKGHWSEPLPPSPSAVRELTERQSQIVACDCGAQHLAQAVTAQRSGDANCGGLYYRSALISGRCLFDEPIRAPYESETRRLAWEIHRLSVKGMLAAASANDRRVAGDGVVITASGQPLQIPVALHGFAWNPSDFQRLHVVESYETPTLSRVHRRSGLGIPIVVDRVQHRGEFAEEHFLPPRLSFAATAVLRPHSGANTTSDPAAAEATLEFYNPHSTTEVELGGRRVALAADVSASLAYRAIREAPAQNPITLFLNPDSASGQEGLYFLEPYQRGKIPVVFVHGLASSPTTWIDMVNDLRAVPGFDDHFQVWAFRYATGSPFLHSAAQLRRGLYESIQTVDPHAQDEALRSIVLVGHSMGGLVSKLQVTGSRDVLWRAIAARPLDDIVADEAVRRQLAEAFFFEPQPNVRRVIFLAVPHGGSPWSRRPVGRLASALVRPDARRTELHARLIASNPGVFSSEVERRLPTSIDMLESTSHLLRVMHGLPLAEYVHADSVVGTGGFLAAVRPGDGVVSVESTQHARIDSVTYVAATHENVHRHPQAIARVRAILQQHLAEYSAAVANRPNSPQ